MSHLAPVRVRPVPAAPPGRCRRPPAPRASCAEIQLREDSTFGSRQCRAFVVGPVPLQQISATRTPSCSATRFRSDPVFFAANATRDLHADGTPCLRAGAGAPPSSSADRDGVMEVQLMPGFDRGVYERHTPRLAKRAGVYSPAAYLTFVSVADGAWMLASYVTLASPPSQAAEKKDGSPKAIALDEVHACFDVINEGLLSPTLEFVALQEAGSGRLVTFEADVELAMDRGASPARAWSFRQPGNLGMLLLAHAGFRPVQRVPIGDPKEQCFLRWMCQVQVQVQIQIQMGGSNSSALSAGDPLQHASHTLVDCEELCRACERHTAELLDRRTRLELLQAIDALCNICWSATSLADDATEKVCRKTTMRQIQYADPTDPLRYRPMNAAQLREHVAVVQASSGDAVVVLFCWTADGHL